VKELVIRFARENSSWGYDRIVGALANLGHPISDQTVGNILRRHDIAPAPKRGQTTTWKEFRRGGCLVWPNSKRVSASERGVSGSLSGGRNAISAFWCSLSMSHSQRDPNGLVNFDHYLIVYRAQFPDQSGAVHGANLVESSYGRND
jgi:hypothetical protein